MGQMYLSTSINVHPPKLTAQATRTLIREAAQVPEVTFEEL